jgi:undecaprenyl-diphosphatase
MLVVVGIAFIIVERRNAKRTPHVTDIDALTFRQALGIGLFQLLSAILPGTSRSGSTILGGLMLGVNRTVAAEFTFFLGIPVMFGASLLKLVKYGFAFTTAEIIVLIVGMVSAFAVSMVCIRFLMDFIKRHDFAVFGWYRIVLGAVMLVYFAVRALV